MALIPVSYFHEGQEEHGIAMVPDQPRARVLMILPLFEEMNRMRRTVVMAMRLLATRRIACLIPDLPGTHESEAALEKQGLDNWRAAINAASTQWNISHIASFRGGALIDHGPQNIAHWRCSPARGSGLLKAMVRTRIAADKEAGLNSSSDALLTLGRTETIELAGNRLGPNMIATLGQAYPLEIENMRTVSLASAGAQPSTNELAGSPLWLRAEPGEDTIFAESIAIDIATWIAQ